MLPYFAGLGSLFGRAESGTLGSEYARKPVMRFLILAAFFLSGVSSLIYQVVWSRTLTLVFGATVFAVTTVLTAFMAGMALGSFYLGRFVDRRGNPLKIYACLQAGIGVFAIILPFILDGVGFIYIAVNGNMQTSFYLLSFIKFFLCFIVLIIPATLIGGTLPVISKFLADRINRLGWNIGMLYAINTFGAVLGCFFAGFILVRVLGVSGTAYLAAAINIVTALGVLFISRTMDRRAAYPVQDEPQRKASADRTPALPGWAGRLSLWVIAVSGFCALAYEVLWTRVLTLFLGSTNYAFTTMLTSFLCGIALGSFLMARFIDARKDVLTILGMVQIGIALSAILLTPVYGKLYDTGGKLTRMEWLISGRFALSFLVMLLPTMLIGATFPLVSKIYTRSLKSLGSSIGKVYSVNTLGSILGSFLAGFILIPHIGIQRAIILIAFLNAAIGAIVIITNSVYSASTRLVFRMSMLVAVVVAMAVAIVVADVGQPLTRLTAIFKGPGINSKLLFYKEGADSCVTVVEDPQGVRRAFVDANQAAEDSRWGLPSRSAIGHLPILLHPDPKTALVIGFGMGVTSWSISRHGVQVDAVEISPGIVEASKYFTRVNHNVLNDPLVRLTVDDGRNYILTTDKKYDMISTGIIHPLVSTNSSGFYTLDFYELCRKTLAEDGIMCQWVPLGRLPEEHYRMIVRTFKAVFPHTTVWYKYTPDFSILIGTPERLKIDYLNFKHRMEKESVRADLALVNMDDPLALLDSFVMDEDAVDEYAAQAFRNPRVRGDQSKKDFGPLHTDNRPLMEFFDARMGDTTSPNILGMKKFRRSVIPLLTNMGEDESDIKSQLQTYFSGTEYTISGQLYYVRGDFENSMRQYRMALDINPYDDNAKWLNSYVESLVDEEAIEEYKEIVRLQPDSATAHAGLGLLYQKRGIIDKAIAEMEKAIQLDPGIAVARINLGAMYQKEGMIDEAIEQFRILVDMKSGSAVIHGRLGDLYRVKGEFSQAEAQFEEALKIDPEMGLIHYSLAVLYLEQGIKLDDGLKHAQKAVQLNPAPNFIAILAGLYYEKMMYADAEREIKRAINMEPDNEKYRAMLAEIQRKMEK